MKLSTKQTIRFKLDNTWKTGTVRFVFKGQGIVTVNVEGDVQTVQISDIYDILSK
jgi:hypothetical protein